MALLGSSLSRVAWAHARACHSLGRNYSKSSSETREYLYEVDHHGQLFLSGTKIRNFTSCYKDPVFLDFFYSRIRQNTGEDGSALERRNEGYEFVSPCGREMNFIKPDDSVIVYQKLQAEGLTYAGTLVRAFEPSELRVDLSSGYLYHPSPPARRHGLSTTAANAKGEASPYGPYSLLRSSLVLEAFSSSLNMESNSGGTYEWNGKKWHIGIVEEGMVVRQGVK